MNGDDENDQRSAEEVLLSAIDSTEDGKLPHFAIRLALSGHIGIPRETEFDFLTEAEAVFAPQPAKKRSGKAKKPTPIAGSKPTTKPKKTAAAKKQIAA